LVVDVVVESISLPPLAKSIQTEVSMKEEKGEDKANVAKD
jgi:hypothetical protein